MRTRKNIWPFGTNQPLGPRSYVVKRRPASRPVSAKAKAAGESEAQRRARKLDDPNLERKLKAHYARGGTLHEFLTANPGRYSNFFDADSESRLQRYHGYDIWPVFGGWKTSLSALATFGTEREVKQFIDSYLAQPNPAGTRGRFQRCVDAVSAKGGAYDPQAVCGAQERKYLKGKRNPSAAELEAERRRLYLELKFKDRYVRGMNRHDAAEWARVRVKRLQDIKDALRRNPSAAAAEVYEEFHGMPSSEIVEVSKRVHFHSHLAALGELEALVVRTAGRADIRLLGFEGAKLCSNERKNQLFVEGGDQALNASDFGYREWPHEKNTLGVVTRLEYFTTKKHLGKEGGTAIYFHEPGKAERGQSAGVGPDLIYDAVNEALEFSGGTYTIRAEGIDR